MNTPNKLTLMRVIMIVPFVFCMLSDLVPHRFLWAFLLFVTASLTDMLDGYLARKTTWLPTSVSLWTRWQTSCW